MQTDLPKFFKSPHDILGFDKRSPVLLALSGGADSSTLLRLLCMARDKFGFKLYAAHVNHGIRTDKYSNEALRDEEFCQRICKEADVELFVGKFDVPALAELSGRSLETEAREARYSFFAQVMTENGIKILATAHNANDNLETQIFNLCRGCGISGVCGIPEVRDFDLVEGGMIVRPILRASRAEILNYCDQNKIEYVTDSTNLEDDCTRNSIRHKIIPTLSELFSSPEKNSLRLSASAYEDNEFLCREAQKFLLSQGDEISVNSLLQLHTSISKRALRIAFERLSGSTLEAIHVNDLLSFAQTKKNGSISLPLNISAQFCDQKLRFEKQHYESSNFSDYSQALFEGINVIENTAFAVMLSKEQESEEKIEYNGNAYGLYSVAHVHLDSISSLSVSNRREGDVILDNGMHKKLKKIMCDKKIPAQDRDSLPIIKNGNEIIYAPQCAVSDVARRGEVVYTLSIYKKKI